MSKDERLVPLPKTIKTIFLFITNGYRRIHDLSFVVEIQIGEIECTFVFEEPFLSKIIIVLQTFIGYGFA